MAVKIVFQNCISSQPLISSLFLKTCCPFSPNTFRNSRNGLQNTLQKKMSKKLHGFKIL
nr:unnamed protein product [Callosobruchus chinensis]